MGLWYQECKEYKGDLTKNEVQTKNLACGLKEEKPEHNEVLLLTEKNKKGAEQMTV